MRHIAPDIAAHRGTSRHIAAHAGARGPTGSGAHVRAAPACVSGAGGQPEGPRERYKRWPWRCEAFVRCCMPRAHRTHRAHCAVVRRGRGVSALGFGGSNAHTVLQAARMRCVETVGERDAAARQGHTQPLSDVQKRSALAAARASSIARSRRLLRVADVGARAAVLLALLGQPHVLREYGRHSHAAIASLRGRHRRAAGGGDQRGDRAATFRAAATARGRGAPHAYPDGFAASSTVTLKPTLRGGRRDASRYGLQRTMRSLQSIGRYVAEMGSFTTQAKVTMTYHSRRALNVHIDTFDGAESPRRARRSAAAGGDRPRCAGRYAHRKRRLCRRAWPPWRRLRS